MIDANSINSLFDAKVYDRDGGKVGTVKQVYLDDKTGRPLFASVATGLFGTSQSFVPLEDASFDGDDLHIPHDKDTVKNAPRIEEDGSLTESEQDRLWSYYSVGAAGTVDTAGRDFPGQTGTHHTDRGSAGSGDDSMTRSEERLNISKENVATGRVRLRKHIVTEQQNITVPVQREEVRLEREPITDQNVGGAVSGPDLTEDEKNVTLHEERVVVNKETVPVERVHLGKETVTDQQNVSEEVAHEEIELDEDGKSPRR